jgi:hypothetical protein
MKNGFGRSPTLIEEGAPRLELAWLAGLLEAEGSFLRPIPSEPGIPAIACQMTDPDVIERVSDEFGTKPQTTRPKGSTRPVFVTRVRGSRAAALMRELAPMMSDRRRLAIAAALCGYSPPPNRKLDFSAAEEIRDMHALGSSVSWLARAFGVSRPTIRQVLEGSIHLTPPAAPRDAAWAPLTAVPAASLLPTELYWLAGWLEGEGSFMAPPPSDPRRVRITATTCDADVADEAGRLLGVTPRLSTRARRHGRLPLWGLLRRGGRAVELMKALYPVMGLRRRKQIDRALAAVDLLNYGGGRYRAGVREGDPMHLRAFPTESDLGGRFGQSAGHVPGAIPSC